jgi:hypothetical protein
MKFAGIETSGVRALWRTWAGALLAANLAACGVIGDDRMAAAFVTPGKYEFHSCRDIENGIKAQRGRQADLERLMAQSSQGFGGGLVNALAYRSDYMQSRGELAVLLKAAEDKHCAGQSPWSSERAVF